MAKEGLAISQVDPSAISASVEAVLPPLADQTGQVGRSAAVKSNVSSRNLEYPVADLVGRCFLRVCFWIEICTSWTKKYHPPEFTVQRAKAQPVEVTAQSAPTASPAIQVQSTVASTPRIIN
ncbi:MAG: hypothetical protein DMG93_03920 [Acidobacteria bacterium]|nr:MAG: hypothetical protein DMG93_03920 [Acidobacteriota bacterium]